MDKPPSDFESTQHEQVSHSTIWCDFAAELTQEKLAGGEADRQTHLDDLEPFIDCSADVYDNGDQSYSMPSMLSTESAGQSESITVDYAVYNDGLDFGVSVLSFDLANNTPLAACDGFSGFEASSDLNSMIEDCDTVMESFKWESDFGQDYFDFASDPSWRDDESYFEDESSADYDCLTDDELFGDECQEEEFELQQLYQEVSAAEAVVGQALSFGDVDANDVYALVAAFSTLDAFPLCPETAARLATAKSVLSAKIAEATASVAIEHTEGLYGTAETRTAMAIAIEDHSDPHDSASGADARLAIAISHYGATAARKEDSEYFVTLGRMKGLLSSGERAQNDDRSGMAHL